MEIIFALALLSVCPLATGLIASRKGRSAVLWAFFGFFLGIFGVLLAAIVPARSANA
jgi:hypothetical protein